MQILELKLKNEEFSFLSNQYSAVQSMSLTGGWEIEVATFNTLWSEEVYRIHEVPFGTPTNTVNGIGFYAPHERERLSKLIETLIQEGRPFDSEFEFFDAKGVHKWVRSMGRPLFDSDGKLVKILGTFQDITVQKKSSLDLLKRTSELTEAQEISKVGSWSFNLLTKQQVWSDEHYKIFEIDSPQAQEKLHELYRSRIHPEDLAELDRFIGRAFTDGEGFIYNHRVVFDNGTRIKYVQGIGRVTKDHQGKSISLSGTCRDRTHDVERDQKYQSILETMNEGLVVQTPGGAIVQFNQAALTILELTIDQLFGRISADPSWKAIKQNGEDFPGDEHPAMVSLRTGQPVSNVIMGLQYINERIKWLSINSVPILEGTIVKLAITTFSDITELVAAKEENQFILDTVGIGVWKFNPITLDLVWDKSMYNLFGLSPDNFSGHYQAWESSLTADAKAEAVKALELAIKGEKEFNHTFEINYKQTEKRSIGGRGKVIRNKDGSPAMMYGINWDKTKEVELEKNLEQEKMRSLHNSKLAAIGQLATGVGHEVNNPLAIISGQISIVGHILKESKNAPAEVFERLNRMESAVIRISKIVSTLRTFSRSDDGPYADFDPYELVFETVNTFENLFIKDEVTFTLTGHKKVSVIHGDKGRVQQVFVNVITNAIEATAGIPSRKIDISVSYETGHIKFAITDNGCGIPFEIRENIFRPFFTTKEVNKGTGIGLSLASSIIKEYEGKLELNSKVGAGSTITIVFPVTIGQFVKVADA